jgi:hypothetical protein
MQWVSDLKSKIFFSDEEIRLRRGNEMLERQVCDLQYFRQNPRDFLSNLHKIERYATSMSVEFPKEKSMTLIDGFMGELLEKMRNLSNKGDYSAAEDLKKTFFELYGYGGTSLFGFFGKDYCRLGCLCSDEKCDKEHHFPGEEQVNDLVRQAYMNAILKGLQKVESTLKRSESNFSLGHDHHIRKAVEIYGEIEKLAEDGGVEIPEQWKTENLSRLYDILHPK